MKTNIPDGWRITLYLLGIAAIAIYVICNFRLYECCQSLSNAGSVVAFPVVAVFVVVRDVRRKNIRKRKLKTSND